MNSKTQFSSVTPEELQSIEGGGILQDIGEAINDAIDAVADFINELTCPKTSYGNCQPEIKTPPGF